MKFLVNLRSEKSTSIFVLKLEKVHDSALMSRVFVKVFYNLALYCLHVSTICKKAAGQLNALSRLKSFLNQDQRNIIANSFIYSNFNYCRLIWHFCSQRLMNKIEIFRSVPCDLFLMITLPTMKHY